MKIHMVKKGDTLYFIGQKYKVSVEEILALNPGITNPDVLEIGMKIKVPSSSGGHQGVHGMDIMHQHVVKQGDTMWKLSKAWGVPLATMIHANPHLKNPNVLLTGEIVNIPKADAQVPAAFGAQSVPGKTPTHPLSPSSLMQSVQGVVGKLSTAPVIGKTFTGFASEKTPTAPIVSPVPPAPAPKPPAAKVEPAQKKSEPKVEPLASKVEPLASKVEPLASKVEPLASKVEPLASKVEPLASKVEPLASKVEPLASKVEPLASKVEPLASKVEPLSTGKTPPNSANIAPLSTGKMMPLSGANVSPLATGDITPNSPQYAPLATGDISPLKSNVAPLSTGKTLPASEANVSPLANVSPMATGNVSPLSNVSPMATGNVSPLSVGNMGAMADNMAPLSNVAPATKVMPYAGKKALPIEKPIETKVTPMHSNYMESVDLFQQYQVPATEAMSMQDSPNIMPYQAGAPSNMGPLSDTPAMYPYDCPPGMYPAGYPAPGMMPYSAGPVWGYGHSVMPLSEGPHKGMVSPLSSNPNAGMVTPLSSNPNAGMVSPLSSNPNAGMVTPLSSNPNAGMVSPLSSNPNASMVSPLSSNPNAGMVTPMAHGSFHEYSAMYPAPGYSGYISGYPTGYPYPVWSNQPAPATGGSEDCGCGGKREEELVGSSKTKTTASKPRKKAKKAVIRTIAPRPKKKSSGESRPWLNR
ncbi:LysM peptidoglycan-binding domain-containing protein [Paenibacillus sp. PL2-23]|uniref:LysM peptidoglycan-binding domain-containing protein n=1 Tax=Paenibacillus sp. PL2-23 TaxID=2100729 RepID=UPI0030F9F9D9